MADLLIQSGRGAGTRYQDLENPTDIWHWLENPPADAGDGIPYAFIASLGDVSRPAPFLYTVELDIVQTFVLNIRYQFLLLYTVGPAALHAAAEDITAALDDGALPVGEHAGLPLTWFPLEQTAAAHQAVEDAVVGKVLIDVSAE